MPTKGENLQKKLAKKEAQVWDELGDQGKKKAFDLGERYKEFLNKAKTERETATFIQDIVQQEGFKSLNELMEKGKKLKAGDRFWLANRHKAIVLGVVGKSSPEEGLRMVGAHIDSPRLDLKPNPLYESGNFALMKTHYYGGIKKYQWLTIPLALHGVVIRADGEKINFRIGSEEGDPIFTITDLLPHLAEDQMKKKANEFVPGEALNIFVGSIPVNDREVKERVKLAVLEYLNEKYGMVEEDLVSAELEAVPAWPARDLGFDRSMVAAYGQDDRVCAFAGLAAILEVKKPQFTSLALFVDKEEIGSMGNTGMQGRFLQNTISDLLALQEAERDMVFKVFSKTKVLSADVTAAADPNYEGVMDKYNAVRFGGGVALMKYTGSRGKAGANDAAAEFLAEVRQMLNDNHVVWQIGELGKVDQGGGGTIAQFLADAGMDVIDCGVPVLSMHSPLEVASKADIYMAYLAYRSFLS